MTDRDRKFIHYWVVQVSNNILQRELDIAGKEKDIIIFIILLKEKLRRAEQEIYITDIG